MVASSYSEVDLRILTATGVDPHSTVHREPAIPCEMCGRTYWPDDFADTCGGVCRRCRDAE